ncbi:hypothetical protein SCOCK_210009 [Actinacidiphila cocklensis]|uniref:Uncharacterized protein n=1 Tax=Actinacidiphila cocklensis TaxID=887465 RepID=A0A9W4DPA2_9ACTN|nr:hypothetical protein SCOCK_210009 [Actinacidiphila cocklensis]
MWGCRPRACCCRFGAAGRRLTVVLDPHRWLELRRFRPLYESGAMSLREIARETGLNRRTVGK